MKYKGILINVHCVFLLLLILDLLVFNFRGFWIDRLIIIAFLLTASATFVVYRKKLRVWGKLYFGFFLFYPLLVPLTLLIDRLGFAIIASPLIITLMVPKTTFSNKDFDIRVPIGIISSARIQLIKKGLITETVLGTCNNEDIVSLQISNIYITSQTIDSTEAIVTSKGRKYKATFYKQL